MANRSNNKHCKKCCRTFKNRFEIDISYEQNKAYTKVAIKDYGAGINSDIKHIFQRFYKKSKNSAKTVLNRTSNLQKSIIERKQRIYRSYIRRRKKELLTIKYLK